MLKKIKNILLAGCWLLHSSFLTAMTTQEAFLQANQLYTSGEYAKAIAIYNAIDHKNAAVWYNLGNCYFCQQELGRAIWAWLQAARIGDKSVALNCYYNLAVAQNNQDHIMLVNYYPKHDFLVWQLLSLLLVYLLFLLLMKKNNKKSWLCVLLFFTEIGILGTTFWYTKKLNVVYAVVPKATTLVAGPDMHYHALGELNDGQIVKVLKDRSGWCYVKVKQVQGWLAKDDLLIV